MRVGTPRASQEQATHRGWGTEWWIGIWSYCHSLLFPKENVPVQSNQPTLMLQFFLPDTVSATTKPWSELLPLIPIWHYATLRPAEKSYSALLRRPSTELGEGHRKKSRRQNEIQVQRSATVASAKLRLKVFFKRHQCVLGVCQRRLQTATRPNLMAPV